MHVALSIGVNWGTSYLGGTQPLMLVKIEVSLTEAWTDTLMPEGNLNSSYLYTVNARK